MTAMLDEKQPEKLHKFEHDIILCGPPDKRVGEPYKQMFKEAFPELNFYDWGSYTGSDYQAKNHEELEKSFMFVGMVPSFPLPALGEEIGYFYCYHGHRVKYCRRGLQLNHRLIKFGSAPETPQPEFTPEFSPPINPIVLIWPDNIEPKYSQKTFSQLAAIVSTTAAAIELVRSNLAWLNQWKSDFFPHIKEAYEYAELTERIEQNFDRRERDPFFELPSNVPSAKKSELAQLAQELGIKPGKPKVTFDLSEVNKPIESRPPPSDTKVGPSKPRF